MPTPYKITFQINIMKNHDETDCDVKLYANGFPSLADAKNFATQVQDLLKEGGINYDVEFSGEAQ